METGVEALPGGLARQAGNVWGLRVIRNPIQQGFELRDGSGDRPPLVQPPFQRPPKQAKLPLRLRLDQPPGLPRSRFWITVGVELPEPSDNVIMGPTDAGGEMAALPPAQGQYPGARLGSGDPPSVMEGEEFGQTRRPIRGGRRSDSDRRLHMRRS